MNVSGHLPLALPLFPPAEVRPACEGWQWHRSTHRRLLQPPKWPLKSHQFMPAHEQVSGHNTGVVCGLQASQSREDSETARPTASYSSPLIIISYSKLLSTKHLLLRDSQLRLTCCFSCASLHKRLLNISSRITTISQSIR